MGFAPIRDVFVSPHPSTSFACYQLYQNRIDPNTPNATPSNGVFLAAMLTASVGAVVGASLDFALGVGPWEATKHSSWPTYSATTLLL